MSSKKYTYDGNQKRDRVNVWQLERTVKALSNKVQILERHVNYLNGISTSQKVINECFSDRIAVLEVARWRKPFHAVKRWFGKWTEFVTGK